MIPPADGTPSGAQREYGCTTAVFMKTNNVGTRASLNIPGKQLLATIPGFQVSYNRLPKNNGGSNLRYHINVHQARYKKNTRKKLQDLTS